MPMSASLQDLLTLRDTTTTTTTASSNTTTPRDSDPTSPRRRSVLVTTTTDLQSLTTVDFNKPEVHTPLLQPQLQQSVSRSLLHFWPVLFNSLTGGWLTVPASRFSVVLLLFQYVAWAAVNNPSGLSYSLFLAAYHS